MPAGNMPDPVCGPHQLDHIIVRNKLKDVTQCRGMHTDDCNSDYTLIRFRLTVCFTLFYRSRKKCFADIKTSSMRDGAKV